MVSLIACGIIGIVAMMTVGSFLLPFPVPLVGIIFFIIILVVGIIKRKKTPSSISYTSNMPSQTSSFKSETPGPDETQFWVCPNCGNDTQMKDGRQYCPSCKFYLSI